MKNRLCSMLLLVAFFLIGTSSLMFTVPNQQNTEDDVGISLCSNAGGMVGLKTTIIDNTFDHDYGGRILIVEDAGLFERGRII